MLQPRLKACADFVTPGAHICDVGTDHALLPVYLFRQGMAESAIAADIAEGPLAAAERTIKKYGLWGKIQTILSDGLRKVPPEGLTHIIIAGMGGETIIHILETCPWKITQHLILQPMTRAALLREWLYRHGFRIEREVCVKEGKFLYTVMDTRFTGDCVQPSAVQKYFGALPLQEANAFAYAKRQLLHLRRAALGNADPDLILQVQALDKYLEAFYESP